MRRRAVALAIAVVGVGLATVLAAKGVPEDVSEVARSQMLARGEDARMELVSKVGSLVRERFDGDWRRAFTLYAGREGPNDDIGRSELMVVLDDADIGHLASRGFWADRILDEVDLSGDGAISLDEFRRVSTR